MIRMGHRDNPKIKGAPSMTAPAQRATPVIEWVALKVQALDPGLIHALDPEMASPPTQASSLSCTLDLSASRAHDAALDILGAYRLTGNFHINLEIALKDIAAFDKVTYEIEPESLPPFRSDCRHVVFRPNPAVRMDGFSDIMRSIKDRIGFDATLPWWDRLLR
jgi:hypothetical protein